MEISWFESFLYGLIAGMTEVLPVSSIAHQNIVQNLFGFSDDTGLFRLSATAGSLIAFLLFVWPLFKRMNRECRIYQARRRKKSKAVNMLYVFDMNVVKTACIPIVIGLLLYRKVSDWHAMIPVFSLLLAVNGLLLHLPMYFAKGNKDSRSMSGMDGLLLGLSSALGYLPGISRMAAGFMAGHLRGGDTQQVFKWNLLLSVPALLGVLCLDAYSILAVGNPSLEAGILVKCLAVAVTSCIGTGLGIGMIKKILLRGNIEGFSYYCWGAALFSFILYLY